MAKKTRRARKLDAMYVAGGQAHEFVQAAKTLSKMKGAEIPPSFVLSRLEILRKLPENQGQRIKRQALYDDVLKHFGAVEKAKVALSNVAKVFTGDPAKFKTGDRVKTKDSNVRRTIHEAHKGETEWEYDLKGDKKKKRFLESQLSAA